jgi:trimeric autotransporter adhesin
MKKKSWLFFVVLMVAVESYGQFQNYVDVDDAVIGSGLNQFNYVGAWAHAISNNDPYLNQTVSYSNTTNNYVTISFKGNRIQIITRLADHHGIAAVSIDNGPESLIDLVRPDRSPPSSFSTVYDSRQTDMKEGTHTLKIRVTGTKNIRATGVYVVLDYVRIFTSAQVNTTAGYQSLLSNTSGANNTAYGVQTLYANTSGSGNTAHGSFALRHNTVGYENTAVGDNALFSNTEGSHNIAVGNQSLATNTTGGGNTAVGHSALKYNLTGYANTAAGFQAMIYNQIGFHNAAFGSNALTRNNGSDNTAVGHDALSDIRNGFGNTGLGSMALSNGEGSRNTAVGTSTLYGLDEGNDNTAIGYGAGVYWESSTGPRPTRIFNNTTALGYAAIVTASDQIRLGNSNVMSIGGQVSWSTLSDGRFKKEVKEDVSGLEFIDKLRPVSYEVDKDAVDKFLRVPDSLKNMSNESRKKVTRQTGFIAQEVEEVIKKTGYVFHGVESPKNEGDHYSIRYAEFVVPLVKAAQELSANDKEQKQIIQELKNELLTLKEELAEYKGGSGALNNADIKTVLYQNNPNPFSADTEIKMTLSDDTFNAVVIVYNLEGRELKNIKVQGRGDTSIKISGKELTPGMYLYALIVDGKVIDTKRMILTQ